MSDTLKMIEQKNFIKFEEAIKTALAKKLSDNTDFKKFKDDYSKLKEVENIFKQINKES